LFSAPPLSPKRHTFVSISEYFFKERKRVRSHEPRKEYAEKEKYWGREGKDGKKGSGKN
jgi:hypothetical protein